MSHLVILALRVVLALLALGVVAAQVLVLVFLAVPFSLLFALAFACVEVALVALWVLLSMVRRDAIFDERAFRWVDVISVAGLVAAVIVAGLCAQAGEVDDAPGLILVGGGIGLAGVAFALLMVVMRGLLRTATQLRRELDEVV